jgi:hypothetical protein
VSDAGSAPVQLILRRANVSRKSGYWQHEDYDVFDGEREIGRIYLIDSYGGNENWFWGVSFQVTGRTSYGRADSLDDAKADSKQNPRGGSASPPVQHQ